MLLHLLLVLLFFLMLKEVIIPPPPSSEKRITLDLTQFTLPPGTKPTSPNRPSLTPLPKPEKAVPAHKIPTPQAVTETHPNKVQKQQINTNKRMVAEKSDREDKATRQNKKRVIKTTRKRKVKKRSRKVIVKRKPEKRPQKRPYRSKLANALLGAGTSVHPRQSATPHNERIIRRLYGREFDSFTPVQKKFIREHLGEIHRITQNTLTRNGYPDIAVRTRQEGVNIVTFYLHPNGDISGLRLKRPIGYTALDQNTLEVIRIAYMHYPHPKTKTKITFYVNYRVH